MNLDKIQDLKRSAQRSYDTGDYLTAISFLHSAILEFPKELQSQWAIDEYPEIIKLVQVENQSKEELRTKQKESFINCLRCEYTTFSIHVEFGLGNYVESANTIKSLNERFPKKYNLDDSKSKKSI